MPETERALIAPHIVLCPTARGPQPAIARNWFKVRVLVEIHQADYSPEEIAEEYDLTLAEVYAGLAYYHDHKDEIDRLIAEDKRDYQEVLAKQGGSLLDRLRTRSVG